jgi:hypothetical protein
MGNPTDQQRIEQLEQGLDEMAQRINARIHSEITRLEDKMTLNQSVLETKHSKLEKSMALMLESQAKIQEGLNQLLMRNATPQNFPYPNPSQNVTRNFPYSTSLTINPLSIPSPVIVQPQHSSLIPTSYLNPPLITTLLMETTINNSKSFIPKNQIVHHPKKQ